MFLLVPAHPGCSEQNAESHKTVVYVCVFVQITPASISKSLGVQISVNSLQQEAYTTTEYMESMHFMVILHYFTFFTHATLC